MRGKMLIAISMLFVSAYAQEDPIQQAIEYLVEFGQSDNQQPDLVQVAEQLTYLKNNPIRINQADVDELLEVPLLNTFLAFNLIEYRRRGGRILSKYQLADVKGFDSYFIQLITPFISLATEYNQSILPDDFKHDFALRYRQLIQQQNGFKTGNYPGHRSENYLRYRLQGEGRLFAGVTIQRDPGEAWLHKGSWPDFLSMHLEYRSRGIMRNIVLGDFTAEFGQGLTLWSSLAFNKSAETVSITRFGRGIRHYSGSDENRFLRGVGSTFRLGSMQFTAFYSSNRVDANLARNAQGETVITSLQQSGFHRTENEIEDRRIQKLKITGTYLEWRPRRLRIGLLSTYTHFGFPWEPNDQIQNVYHFSGQEMIHTAVDFKWRYDRLFAFGEGSYEWRSRKMAVLAGLQVQAADPIQWMIQFRFLQPGWISAYNAPFSETGSGGERGFYLGLKWQLPMHLSLAMYADHFQYLWLRSNLNRLGIGSDYMAQLNYQPNRFHAYVRFRRQSRPRTVGGPERIRLASDTRRYSIRFQGNYPLSNSIKLQTRAEWSHVAHSFSPEKGLLLFLGFRWRISPKWELKTRYTVFDTESYGSAIWAYEDDVPYSFSVPAFFNTGSRWYAVLRYDVTQKVELWFRIAETSYPYQQSIGSGDDHIRMNKRTELKCLIRMSF